MAEKPLTCVECGRSIPETEGYASCEDDCRYVVCMACFWSLTEKQDREMQKALNYRDPLFEAMDWIEHTIARAVKAFIR